MAEGTTAQDAAPAPEPAAPARAGQGPELRVMRLAGGDPAIPLPEYRTAGAAGADLCANLGLAERARGVTLPPLGRALIPTGLALAIPEGWEVQIRPRSGLALKQGLTLPNSPGTIDSDYRGPLGVIVLNLGAEPVTIRHGDRIAQMVVAPAPQARFRLVEALEETARGQGGFGSTGIGGRDAAPIPPPAPEPTPASGDRPRTAPPDARAPAPRGEPGRRAAAQPPEPEAGPPDGLPQTPRSAASGDRAGAGARWAGPDRGRPDALREAPSGERAAQPTGGYDGPAGGPPDARPDRSSNGDGAGDGSVPGDIRGAGPGGSEGGA